MIGFWVFLCVHVARTVVWRLLKNPTYYNIQGTTNIRLSKHVSEMVKTMISDLKESKCVQIKESTNNEDGEIQQQMPIVH